MGRDSHRSSSLMDERVCPSAESSGRIDLSCHRRTISKAIKAAGQQRYTVEAARLFVKRTLRLKTRFGRLK